MAGSLKELMLQKRTKNNKNGDENRNWISKLRGYINFYKINLFLKYWYISGNIHPCNLKIGQNT
jgi:hypothetical protein